MPGVTNGADVEKLGGTAGWFVGTIFLIYLAIGIMIFRDYGVSWDEPFHREYGQTVFDYVFKGDLKLLQSTEVMYHGPFFDFALTVAEGLLPLTDTRDIYFARHLFTFLFFFGGAVSFYFLCKQLFKSWKLGLLGSAFLILHPRLFAHSFYNTTDIPFLSCFIVSVLTMVWFVDRRTVGYGVLHALSCSILIAIRLIGVIVPAMTLVVLLLDSVIRGRRDLLEIVAVYALYATVLLVAVVLFWPTLWHNPIHEFWMALRQAAALPHLQTVRYLGRDILATTLPWHYLPVWLTISTPLMPLCLSLVGLGKVVSELSGGGNLDRTLRKRDLVAVMWVTIPFLCVVVVRPVLYDGWRHFFFIYPGIVLMALIGLQFLWQLSNRVFNARGALVGRWAIGLALSVSLVSSGLIIKQYHPFQNVYFNELIGGVTGAKGKFELDYWGLSYRRGLEYVLETDNATQIPVYVAHEVGTFNALILDPNERKRLRFVEEIGKARYLLTNFRWQNDITLGGQPYYSLTVGGAEILTVRKLGSA